jgi:hypothetical protein
MCSCRVSDNRGEVGANESAAERSGLLHSQPRLKDTVGLPHSPGRVVWAFPTPRNSPAGIFHDDRMECAIQWRPQAQAEMHELYVRELGI